MLICEQRKGLFLSVCVDDIKLAGKKQNISPTWKISMKDLDLGEPTFCLDHVYLGCTQRECQISKDTRGGRKWSLNGLFGGRDND